MADVTAILAISGVIIILGLLSELLFRKTDFPSTVLLLLFGALLGPGLGVFSAESFLGVAELLAAIAIIIILFQGGLALDLKRILRQARPGFMLAMLALVFPLPLTIIVVVLSGQSAVLGLLLGAIIAGTSGVVILPILGRLRRLSEDAGAMLSFGSISEAVSIVLATIAMSWLTVSEASPIRDFVNSMSIGLFFGLLLGFAWIFFERKLRTESLGYLITLAFLFLAYAVIEFSGGSGAVAVFTIGMVLANTVALREILRMKPEPYEISAKVREQHDLISFMVRTFFLVYLGILVSGNLGYLLLGIFLLFAMFVLQPLSVALATIGMSLTTYDRRIMNVLIPRGWSTAVLAFLPAARGISGTAGFVDVAFVVVLGSGLLSTLFIKLYGMMPEEARQKKASPRASS